MKKLNPNEDKGKYECKTGVMSTVCDVAIRRKIWFLKENISFNRLSGFFSFLSAALRIEEGLKDVKAIEEEDATFEVKLTKADSRGKWFKDGKVIYPDQK